MGTSHNDLSPEFKWVLAAIRELRQGGADAIGTGVVPTFKSKATGFSMDDLYVAQFRGKGSLRATAEAMEKAGLLEVAGRKGSNGKKYVVYHIGAEKRAERKVRKESMSKTLAAISARL